MILARLNRLGEGKRDPRSSVSSFLGYIFDVHFFLFRVLGLHFARGLHFFRQLAKGPRRWDPVHVLRSGRRGEKGKTRGPTVLHSPSSVVPPPDTLDRASSVVLVQVVALRALAQSSDDSARRFYGHQNHRAELRFLRRKETLQ